MEQYRSHLEALIEHPEAKFYADRTGAMRLRVPKHKLEVQDVYDFDEGFPILTTKRVPFKMVARELAWFLSGDTRLSTLLDKNIHIWTPDAMNAYRKKLEEGDSAREIPQDEFEDRMLNDEDFRHEHDNLGPIYSHQWRNLPDNDQIRTAIGLLRDNPFTSRSIVDSWNPGDLSKMALPPCHALFQMIEYDDGFTLKMFQRSADMVLGVPFNISSYALLAHLIGAAAGIEAKGFSHTFGDDHVYGDHLPVVAEQLTRASKALPKLIMSDDIGDAVNRIIEGTEPDPLEAIASRVRLEGYDPEPWLYAPLHTGLPEHLLSARDRARRADYREQMREEHPEYAAALESNKPATIPFNGREYPVIYERSA